MRDHESAAIAAPRWLSCDPLATDASIGSEMKQFEGKTAVVTGAASGIGRALAERFAKARMQVVLADIEKDALDRAVRELEERQHRVIGVVANTMVRDSVKALAERAIGEFGKVHVVCNNAGIAA